MRATAYPTVERGGIVWAYMGARATPPPMPELEATQLDEVQLQLAMRECNWVQAMEADLDTGHVGFLHWGSVRLQDTRPGSFAHYAIKETIAALSCRQYRVWHVVRRLPAGRGGLVLLAYRCVSVPVLHDGAGRRAWAAGRRPLLCAAGRRAHDGLEHRAASGEAWCGASGRSRRRRISRAAAGRAIRPSTCPIRSDWLGRWRYVQNPANDYLIDRDLQRTASYTGIVGANQQDQGITESMGGLSDRTQEHLGTSDLMIARTRQRLLRAMKALRDSGTTPPGVDDPEVYRVRSGGALLPRDADWLEATAERRKAFVDHPELEEQAAAL